MKVTLGTLKDKGEELASFLEPRVGAKPSLEGGAIEIEDEGLREGVKPRQVKTYIKRFLYMKGVRKNYRIFVSGKELTIQEIVLGEKGEEEKEEKEEKKAEVKKTVEAPTPAEPETEAPAEPTEAPEVPETPAEPKPRKGKKTPSRKPRAKKKKTGDSEE